MYKKKPQYKGLVLCVFLELFLFTDLETKIQRGQVKFPGTKWYDNDLNPVISGT